MTPSRPCVSVVIPTRGRPELLRRAVRSILDQRYAGDVEILVVFDQTGPEEIDLPVPPRRTLRGLTNVRTPGLAGGRNTGIEASRGQLVAYCDDDDEWLPGKLEAQVSMLDASSEGDVVVTGTTIVYRESAVDRVPDRPRLTFDDLLRSRAQEVHPSSILVRRDAMLERIGLVDEELPGSYGEDYEWLLRAARGGPILVVQEALTRVHWHRSSFFADRWSTIIEAIQYLLTRYPEFQRQPIGLARLYGRLAFANAALGHRSEAWRWAGRAIRLRPRERRAYLALAVTSGVISAERVVEAAHRRGKGI
jgi:glycosyltransferase involved in cell wall biosynthesis